MSTPALQTVYNIASDGQSEPSLMSANVPAGVWELILKEKNMENKALCQYRQMDVYGEVNRPTGRD
jgi:hypothetical protein